MLQKSRQSSMSPFLVLPFPGPRLHSLSTTLVMERTTMRGIRSVCGEEVSDVVDRMPSSKLPRVIKEALTIVRDVFYPDDKEVQTAISECLSTNLVNRAELSK